MILTKLSGLTLPGTGYPKIVNFADPTFPAGDPSGVWILGGDTKLQARNLDTDVTDLLTTGVPTVNDKGAVLSYQNYYESSSITGSAEVTIIAIAKPPAANPSNAATSFLLASQYSTGAAGGDSLAFYTGGLTVFMSTDVGTANTAPLSLTGATPADWNSFVGRVKADGKGQAWWGHNGVVSAGAESAANTRAIQGTRKWRIGAPFTTNFQASGNVLMAAIFPVALSDAQIAENLAYLSQSFGPSLDINTL